MIYVGIEGLKSEGRGSAMGNGWHATDDVTVAVAAELQRFHGMWDALGHGTVTTYRITVAPEASPRRTTTGAPLPVKPEGVGDEPSERIDAAIEMRRRHEDETKPRALSGLPNDIARAQGEVNAYRYIRELLEQPLPLVEEADSQ